MACDEVAAVKRDRFNPVDLSQGLDPIVSAFSVKLAAAALQDADVAGEVPCRCTVSDFRSRRCFREPAICLVVQQRKDTID